MTRGAFIFGCEGPTLSPSEKAFFRTSNPFGFILFARNVVDPDQLRSLTGDLRDSVGWDAPVFIDQEGGRVARMGPPHWREWMPALAETEKIAGSVDRALWLRYRLIAAELRAVGIDGNCAPLCDIAEAATHPVLRNRCYGTNPEDVARHGRAVAEGCLHGGVLPVLKHIPGLGRARLDTHLELPRVAASEDELAAHDFAPFTALSDLPLGMSSHIVFAAIDGQPTTTSRKMIDLIRDQIGFHGLLMTDDISMEALSGTVADRGRAALNAGCDVVLHCNGDLREMETIAALGELSNPGQDRAEAALRWRKSPTPVDILALEAEFDAIPRRPV